MRPSALPPNQGPDALLADYRARGKPDDLAALFDAAAPELFRLALRLCPDAASAEDVLQETFLVVIERANAWDPTRPAMPWLTGILKNTARMSRRTASRTPDPWRLVLPESEEDPALGVADAEERRLVQEAMERLPEPLRGAALLRWRYGLEPAEIAHVRGVPPGTVRSWLHRALKSLRVEVGAIPAFFLFFRPERGLDGIRRALVRRAAAKAAATSAAGTGAAVTLTLALGGVLMAKKLVLACVVLLLVVGVGWFSLWPADVATHGGTAAGGESTPTARAQRPPRRPARAGSEADDVVNASFAVDRDRDLHGVVVLEDETPVSGATIEAVANPWARLDTWTDSEETVAAGRTRSAEDGTFALRLRRGEVVMLRVSKAGLAAVDLPDVQAGERVRVVLGAGIRLVVSVKDDDGRAVAGAGLKLQMTSRGDPLRTVGRATTDAEGLAAIDGLPPRGEIWISVLGRQGYEDPPLAVLPASGEARHDMVVRPGVVIRGRVTDAATGRPVGGARVGLGWNFSNEVAAGPDGAYSLGGFRPRMGVNEVHAQAAGYARSIAHVAENSEVVDLALHKGFRVRGRAVSAAGAPVGSAFVSVSARLRIGEEDHLSAGSAQTGADGTYVVGDLDRLLEQTLAVAADGAGCVRRVVRRPATDEDEIDLGDVVLPAPRAIGGTVEDASGTALVRMRVVLRGPTAREGGGSNLGDGLEYRMTDDVGRFRFADLSPGEFVLSTSVAGEPEVCTTVVVPPASDVGDVVLRAERTRAVVVRVVDDSGGSVPGAIVSVATPAGLGGHAVAGKDGVARLATSERDLRISFLGTWEHVAGRSFLPAPALEVPAGGPTEVTLALRAGAAVSGTVLDPDGKPLPHVLVKAIHGALPPSVAWTEPDGRFSMTVPAQGTVGVTVDGLSSVDGKPVDLLVEGTADAVAPGTEGLVIRCTRVEAGRTLVVRVTTPDGEPVAGVRVDARYSANPVPVSATTGADGRAELAGLTSRAHVIHASGKGAWLPPRSTGAKVVPAGQEVTLVLRRSATIRGVVVTEDGRPAPGVSVSVGADEESGSSAYGAAADDQGAFVLLVPEEARGPFTVQAFGLVGSAQVRGSVADVRAGDGNVRLVVRK